MFRKARLLSQLRPRATNTDASIFLNCSLTHLHTQERMKTSVASRFIDLAEPDRDTGKSAWVCFREYPELQTSNGSSWSRDDKLRCRNTDRWYLVEKKRRNDSPTGQIVAMRCVGIDLAPHDRNIPQGIFNQIKSMPCVETGATAEVDHKNGRYNAGAKTLEDFQPLCRTSNLVKRSACKKCKETGLRHDATMRGWPVPWLEGGEEFGDGDPKDATGCRGCYYYDIAHFKAEAPHVLARAEKQSSSEAFDEARSSTDTPARMRSIQYLGAKTKLLPSLLDSFDKVRAQLQPQPHRVPCGPLWNLVEPTVSPRAVPLTCAHLSLRQARGSVPRSGVTIVDAFCGSGVVTHAAAVAGYHVESFDTESYARTLAAGATAPFTEEAKEAIRAMQAARSASGAHGLIAIEYSPSGPQQRMFWTAENAAHIDAARQLIPSFSMECQPFLLASLLVSADAVANTTGVYGAYLKQFKTAALNPMVVRPLHKCTSPAPAGSRVLCGDDAIAALAMLAPVPKASGIRMVYADPPYNQRQYSANYAPLKLLSEYQAGAVRAETKSGLAIEAYKSTFCRRTDVASAFEGLVTSARACADYLVVSYSSDGLLNRTDLDEILGDRATCQIIEHKRYRAARGQAPAGSPTKVSELLYVVPL